MCVYAVNAFHAKNRVFVVTRNTPKITEASKGADLSLRSWFIGVWSQHQSGWLGDSRSFCPAIFNWERVSGTRLECAYLCVRCLVLIFNRGHATLLFAVSVRPSVGTSEIFSELRAVYALLLLPNRPRLDCRISSLVFLSLSFYIHFNFSETFFSGMITVHWIGYRKTFFKGTKNKMRIILF